MSNVRIGAHISISKGMVAALDKAAEMGANCIQVFSTSPRTFAPPIIDEKRTSEFASEAKKRDIGPNFVHAGYLINLGSDKPDLLKKSIIRLSGDMSFAHAMGGAGAIVHTGSHTGRGFESIVSIVAASIKEVLEKSLPGSKLLLEIASGGNGKIGSTFEELSTLLKAVGSQRVGVCLDTCHMFAGGYAFNTTSEVDVLAQKIESTVGFDRIWCMHANDSKGEFNSALDRHENIGDGRIGNAGFKALLAHPKFSKIPFLLETPGLDGKGPDKENVERLKKLA